MDVEYRCGLIALLLCGCGVYVCVCVVCTCAPMHEHHSIHMEVIGMLGGWSLPSIQFKV